MRREAAKVGERRCIGIRGMRRGDCQKCTHTDRPPRNLKHKHTNSQFSCLVSFQCPSSPVVSPFRVPAQVNYNGPTMRCIAASPNPIDFPTPALPSDPEECTSVTDTQTPRRCPLPSPETISGSPLPIADTSIYISSA